MKKAFISMPMHGLSDKEVKEMQAKYHEQVKELGYEPLNTMFEGPQFENNERPWMLPRLCIAEAIRILMTETDMLFLAPGWERARGCVAEYYMAGIYGIPVSFLENKPNNPTFGMGILSV